MQFFLNGFLEGERIESRLFDPQAHFHRLFVWPADLRDKQIFEKLLALNWERAAEEAKAAKVKKSKAQRTKQADELV